MKIIKLKLFLASLILLLILPNISLAAVCTRPDGTTYENRLNICYPEIGGFTVRLEMDINQLIAWFYYFVITISGLAIFAMLVWGGFTWLTSTGDPAKIADAKERIYSAFLGLLLILASYLIMQVINPELVVLNLPSMPPPPGP